MNTLAKLDPFQTIPGPAQPGKTWIKYGKGTLSPYWCQFETKSFLAIEVDYCNCSEQLIQFER